GEALPLDAALGDVDLAIERGDLGTGTLHRELVRARVDDEQEVALLHALIVLDVQLGDRPAHLRHDPDDVRRHDGIVRLRVLDDPPEDDEGENDRARDDAEADVPCERASSLAHPSFRRARATWRRSTRRRGTDRRVLPGGGPTRFPSSRARAG